MIINTKSWHYQLSVFLGRSPATNLCEYMRALITGLALVIVTIAGGTFIAFVCVLQPILNFVFGWDWQSPFALIAGLGLVIDAMFLWTWLVREYFYDWTEDLQYWWNKRTLPTENNNTSVLRLAHQWWNDVHNKVCRMVTYE